MNAEHWTEGTELEPPGEDLRILWIGRIRNPREPLNIGIPVRNTARGKLNPTELATFKVQPVNFDELRTKLFGCTLLRT